MNEADTYIYTDNTTGVRVNGSEEASPVIITQGVETYDLVEICRIVKALEKSLCDSCKARYEDVLVKQGAFTKLKNSVGGSWSSE